MNRVFQWVVIGSVVIIFALANAQEQEKVQSPERIITTSNVITEIIVSLGKESELVGIDTTSKLSDSLKKLPDIGYRLMLSTEGILSLQPTLIFLADDSGPKNVIAQIEQLKTKQVVVKKTESLADIEQAVTIISNALGVGDKGSKLNAKIARDYQQLQHKIAKTSPITAFFMMENYGGSGSNSYAGRATNADLLLTAMGMINPFSREFSSYKTVSLEAQLKERPQVIFIGRWSNYAGDPTLYSQRKEGMKEWPTSLQPQCVIDVDVSHFLIFGIHIYELANQLREVTEECLLSGHVHE